MLTKFTLGLMAALMLAGPAASALLGVTIGFPQIAFNSTGTTTYTATDGRFEISATPLAIRVLPATIPHPIINGGLAMSFFVNPANGDLVSGVPGDDFVLTGEAVVPGLGPVAGVLLRGQIQAFGFEDTGLTTDNYDMIFSVDGGALAPLFVGQDISVDVSSENSTFTGDFTVDFSGGAKGAIGSTPRDVCDITVEKTCVPIPPSQGGGTDCDGKVTSLVLEYTGAGCQPFNNPQADKASCDGGANGAEPVSVEVTGKDGSPTWGFEPAMLIGDTIDVIAANGGEVKLDSETLINVDVDLENVNFHTSCSKPLNVGDEFGSFLVVELTSTDGGTVTLDPPTPPMGVDECTIPAPPVAPEGCDGKLQIMTLRYIGGPCEVSNPQIKKPGDSPKASCDGIDLGTTEPVNIIASDKDGKTTFADEMDVPLDGLIQVIAVEGSSKGKGKKKKKKKGKTRLPSETKVQIFDTSNDLLQDIKIHTSCSRPLAIGDVFGGVEVVGLQTDASPSLPLPTVNIEYLYEITNIGSTDALNVTAVDDVAGVVPGSPIPVIAPGQSVVLSLDELVTENVTNTVLVSAENAAGGICDAADTATVIVTPPGPGPDVCTTKVKAMSLLYTGPTLTGVNVVVTGKSGATASYVNVDLVQDVTILTAVAQNGFMIDATASGKTDLGSRTTISIAGVDEVIHTSCSTPFRSGFPAPLDSPKGDPSGIWFVDDFMQK
ncbi:MAG: hypothetical protein JRG82_06890 [Deltaproteobacteria bacterium]|nr:hypothetical protein [Deltaproteobacteria bacterium]